VVGHDGRDRGVDVLDLVAVLLALLALAAALLGRDDPPVLAARRLRLRGEQVREVLVVVGSSTRPSPSAVPNPIDASAIGAGSCECSITSRPCSFSSSWATFSPSALRSKTTPRIR
jgi:hypothetical protein